MAMPYPPPYSAPVTRRCALWIVLALAIAACTEAPTETTTTAAPTTTAPEATTTPTLGRCADEFEFAEGGQIADLRHEASDSRTIGVISWSEEEDCETFTVDFQTSEGAPATTPPSAVVSHLETFQVLRIRLFNVDATVVTDQLVETTLVDRLYVVTSLDEGMFIDLHLAEPAQARVEGSASPARLTLTLKPGLVPITGFSTITDRLVVTTPPGGVVVDPFVTVSGYSRTFEGNVAFVATSGNDIVLERNTTAADWSETWGEFRSTLSLPPGEVSLSVGEVSPEDGSLEGATIRLTVR